MNKSPKERDIIRQECIDLKMSDVDAAERCDITLDCWIQWRHRNGYGPRGNKPKINGKQAVRNAQPVTEADGKAIAKMKLQGYNNEIIAKMIRRSLYKVSEWVKQNYKGLSEIVTVEREMPPVYVSTCTVRVDKQEAEQLAVKSGASAIVCKLGEGKKAVNLNGVVIGASFYRNGRRGQI